MKHYMKSTRTWGPCSCGCGKTISEGVMFEIHEGLMYIEKHKDVKKEEK